MTMKQMKTNEKNRIKSDRQIPLTIIDICNPTLVISCFI